MLTGVQTPFLGTPLVPLNSQRRAYDEVALRTAIPHVVSRLTFFVHGTISEASGSFQDICPKCLVSTQPPQRSLSNSRRPELRPPPRSLSLSLYIYIYISYLYIYIYIHTYIYNSCGRPSPRGLLPSGALRELRGTRLFGAASDRTVVVFLFSFVLHFLFVCFGFDIVSFGAVE